MGKKNRHWDFKINADYEAHCLGVKGNGEENTSLIQRQSPCTGALTPDRCSPGFGRHGGEKEAGCMAIGRVREGERNSDLLFKSKCKCKDCFASRKGQEFTTWAQREPDCAILCCWASQARATSCFINEHISSNLKWWYGFRWGKSHRLCITCLSDHK